MGVKIGSNLHQILGQNRIRFLGFLGWRYGGQIGSVPLAGFGVVIVAKHIKVK